MRQKKTRAEKEQDRREEFKRLMKEHGLTQAAVAGVLGITHESTINRKLRNGPISKPEMVALRAYVNGELEDDE